MLGDSEDFLSLEEGDDAASEETSHHKESKSSSKPPAPESTLIDAEVIDMDVLGDYSGTHTVTWPIQDMDCPHCASVAMLSLIHI